MTGIQTYHENLMLILVRKKAKLTADIQDIKTQLEDNNYWNKNNKGWRMAARKSKSRKYKELELINYAIKNQKRKVHISKQIPIKLNAPVKKKETKKAMPKPKKNRLLVTEGQLVSFEEQIETNRVFRNKIKELLSFDDYVEFCRREIEPVQIMARQRVLTRLDGDREKVI